MRILGLLVVRKRFMVFLELANVYDIFFFAVPMSSSYIN